MPLGPSDLSVFVQCPAALRPGFELCRQSIAESDIADYELCLQNPAHTVFEHFLDLLDKMAAAPTDLVLRLEDDVEVNRFIVHNLVTWPAIHDKRFGMGWAFDPGGRTFSIHDRIYGRPPSNEIWESAPLAYSLGVLMWTRDVPTIRNSCAEWYAERGGDAQDLALTMSVRALNREVVIHAPSLTEHMVGDVPSTLGHAIDVHGTSRGSFFRDWRRGAPRFDTLGREVGVQ